MTLLVKYKKGKSFLQREVKIVSKGENIGQLNKRATTIERVKQIVYGKNKYNDVLIVKIIDKKLIGYGVQD
jgi:hypothetical protein